MNTRFPILALLVPGLLALAACSPSNDATPAVDDPQVSGRIEGGLRVLTIDPTIQRQNHDIYRGDYVRFELASGEAFTVEIPALETTKSYPVAEGDKAYVKFPDAGTFPYTIGDVSGEIHALELQAAAYREVTAPEAAALIANVSPVILDVRTPREFQGGHLQDAVLIPVQEIQKRWPELAEHKDDPVFIYCRSGNRSTVAAKVLMDNGFKQVINLRKGIADWARNDLPIVK